MLEVRTMIVDEGGRGSCQRVPVRVTDQTSCLRQNGEGWGSSRSGASQLLAVRDVNEIGYLRTRYCDFKIGVPV